MANDPNFIPIYNTYDKWVDASLPLGDPLLSKIRVDNGTETYEYCDGTTIESTEISFWLTGVTRTDHTLDDEVEYEQRFAVSATTAPTEDLTIKVTHFTRFIDKWGTDTEWQNQQTFLLTILSGETVGILEFLEPLEYWVGDGGGVFDNKTLRTFQLEAQSTSVNCAAPPATCTLEITGSTTVNPTFQGGTDGSITIEVSGSTGTTQYSLDGGTPQVSNIFSGLAAGTYEVEASEELCYDVLTGITLNDGEFRTGDFIVVEPNDYVASENPIVTTLGTAVNDATPADAITTLTVDSQLLNNYSVRFNLSSPTAYDVTFTAKDFPNRDNFFTTPILKNRAGINVGVNTNAENASSLAEAIQKDINLSRWYFIDVNDEVVTLTSKEETASMTLNGSNVEILDETGSVATTGITLAVLQDGVDAWQGSLVDDYSLFTDIYVDNGELEYGDVLSGGTYNNYTSLELPFSQDNEHQFDVSSIMKTFVSTQPINFNSTGATHNPTAMRAFYIKYGEKYPLVANENTKKKREKGETGYKWCINSALEWESANTMESYIVSGSTGDASNPRKQFLTNSPNPLDIQREQSNYLYFVLEKDYPNPAIDVRGDIVYYDGTTDTGVTFFTITSGVTNSGGVYALDLSYTSLGLAAFEASGNTKVKRVTFTVFGNDGAIEYTEDKVYRFEIDEQPRKFGVAFENKLGAYDTFDFIGVVENTISRVSKNYTIPREINPDGSSPQQFKNLSTYDTKVVNQVIVNSGWIDEEHFNWLIELLQSNNIYSYSEPNQNYLNVSGYTYKKSSLDDLFEIEVTYNHTIFNNGISV